jgi:hypothetical protein
MSVRPDLHRPVLLLGLGALVLIGLGLSFRWWDHYVEDGLSKWAVDELDRRSHGIYHLAVGDVTFLPLSNRLSFDSATVVTDSARKLSQSSRLPVLQARAYRCVVSGLNLPKLLFRKRFDARLLGCQRVEAGIGIAPGEGRHENPADPPRDRAPKFVARPLGLASFRFATVWFPSVSVTLQRPGPEGGASAHLRQARFSAAGLVFDPTENSAPGRSVIANRARLEATGLVLHPDTLSAIGIARLEAGLEDSTLRLSGARQEPSMTDEQWVRTHRFRRDRVRFALDSLKARGVSYRSLLATGDIAMRTLEVRGALLDVLMDKRLPTGRPPHHRSPQAVAAGASLGLHVDTARITGGRIVYHERNPTRTRAGRVFFDSVRGKVLDLDFPSQGKPLTIEASGRLMNEGLLSVHATVPLDAPDFRFELTGKLGSMPATALNEFLAENQPFKLQEGEVDAVEFRQTALRGTATTNITPRYRKLSVEPSDTGGSVFSSVKRAMNKVWANTFKIRSENPEDDGKRLRTAITLRTYDPANTWIQFLWFGLRDGLREVITK